MNNDEVLLKVYNIDGKDYYVINELDYNNSHYLYLSNKNDPDDIMLRKIKNGYLELLDNEQELKSVLNSINN